MDDDERSFNSDNDFDGIDGYATDSDNEDYYTMPSSKQQQQFATLGKYSGDIKASLGLLVETGICKVNASASLVVMPTSQDYSGGQNLDQLDPLPPSAKDIYFKQQGTTNPSENAANKDDAASSSSFLNDQWYFIEVHQSILQESTQKQ